MALKDITLTSYAVKVGKNSFDVRGLAFADITALMAAHREDMEALFNQFMTNGMHPEHATNLGMTLISQAPDVAAHVIALAADEIDQLAKIRRLPIDVQLDAIENIGRLTFEEVGGPKKFAEVVLRIAKATTGVVTSLRTSTSGSLESAAR